MTSPDPVVANIAAACAGATPAQVIAGVKTAGFDRHELARAMVRETPWSQGNRADRWVHRRGNVQLLTGTPGLRLAEMTDLGNDTAAVFLHVPDPDADPAVALNGPLDGMTALNSVAEVVPRPDNMPAAWALLEARLAAMVAGGH